VLQAIFGGAVAGIRTLMPTRARYGLKVDACNLTGMSAVVAGITVIRLQLLMGERAMKAVAFNVSPRPGKT